nr:transcription factor tau subunit sfc1 [Quercus suber]
MEDMESSMTPVLDIPPGRVVSVEHPCIVKNFDVGLKSLGGEAQLVDVLDHRVGDSLIKLDGKTKVLPEPFAGLSLRPHDHLAKKIPSAGTETRDVLVRVTVPARTGRKRKRGSNDPFSIPSPPSERNDSITAPELLSRLRDNPHNHLIEPISHIPEVHRFREPPDYQLRDSELTIMQTIRSHLFQTSYDRLKGFEVDISPGDNGLTAFPIAPNLASTEKHYRYDYEQASGVRNIITEDGQVESEQRFPNARKAVLPISVYAPSPLAPPPELVLKDFGDAVPNAIARFQALMETRPLVSRRYLLNVFPDITETIHKEAVQWCGYSFEAGPFAHLIVRYGVDPRSDPQYRFYQSLTFKIEDAWLEAGAAARAARRSKGEPAHDHVFDGHRLEATGRTWQVCDVTDPLLQHLLATAPVAPTCDPSHAGFYHPKTLCLARAIMRDKMRRLFLGHPVPDDDYARLLAVTDLCAVDPPLTRRAALALGLPDHARHMRADVNSQARTKANLSRRAEQDARDRQIRTRDTVDADVDIHEDESGSASGASSVAFSLEHDPLASQLLVARGALKCPEIVRLLCLSAAGHALAGRSTLDLFAGADGSAVHERETDEKEQVARQDAHTCESGEFLTSAHATGRKPGEVAGCEVSVGREVDEAEINDELDDLHHGDVLLPPNTDATCGLEVIPVHDDVHGQIQGDGNPRDGGQTKELGVAEEGRRTMVVGVEKGQRLLLEEEEAGIDEFEVFSKIVELDARYQDGEEQAISGQGRDQLFKEQRQQDATDGGEVEVVNLKQAVQLERLPVPHHLTPPEDDNVPTTASKALEKMGHKATPNGRSSVGAPYSSQSTAMIIVVYFYASLRSDVSGGLEKKKRARLVPSRRSDGGVAAANNGGEFVSRASSDEVEAIETGAEGMTRRGWTSTTMVAEGDLYDMEVKAVVVEAGGWSGKRVTEEW